MDAGGARDAPPSATAASAAGDTHHRGSNRWAEVRGDTGPSRSSSQEGMYDHKGENGPSTAAVPTRHHHTQVVKISITTKKKCQKLTPKEGHP